MTAVALRVGALAGWADAAPIASPPIVAAPIAAALVVVFAVPAISSNLIGFNAASVVVAAGPYHSIVANSSDSANFNFNH